MLYKASKQQPNPPPLQKKQQQKNKNKQKNNNKKTTNYKKKKTYPQVLHLKGIDLRSTAYQAGTYTTGLQRHLT